MVLTRDATLVRFAVLDCRRRGCLIPKPETRNRIPCTLYPQGAILNPRPCPRMQATRLRLELGPSSKGEERTGQHIGARRPRVLRRNSGSRRRRERADYDLIHVVWLAPCRACGGRRCGDAERGSGGLARRAMLYGQELSEGRRTLVALDIR